MKLTHYSIANKEIWTGRVDSEEDYDSFRIHQVIELIDLNASKFNLTGKTKFCLLGFRCDEGIRRNLGRQGAEKGPEYIRKELANIPVTFNKETKIYDAGDIYCLGHNLETAQEQLAIAVKRILQLGMFPIILGGGHEVAFGHYIGLSEFLENTGETLGIINFDAHFDLRPYKDKGSSGTMFSQIADFCQSRGKEFSYMVVGIQTYANTISLFKRADKLNVKYILAKEFTEDNYNNIRNNIMEFVNAHDRIYLTLCSDVFNAAFAPGVSAPQPFGMNPEVVLLFLKEIFSTGKVISWDIAEISPRFDHDNRTAKLAAVLIYAVINVLSEKNSANYLKATLPFVL